MHRTEFERAHAHFSERRDTFLSARTLSELEQLISEHMCLVLCKSKGNPRASREICARAGRFAREQGNPRESKGNPRASREIRAGALY